MTLQARLANLRAALGVGKQAVSDENTGSSGSTSSGTVANKVLKPRAISSRSALTGANRPLTRAKSSSGAITSGTKVVGSGFKATLVEPSYTTTSAKEPQQNMALMATRKTRVPLSTVEGPLTQVYRDPEARTSRTRRPAPLPTDDTYSTAVLATRPILNKAIAPAAAPRRILRTSSSSGAFVSSANISTSSIVSCNPIANVAASTAAANQIPPAPIIGHKRRANSIDDSVEGRVVRAKLSIETAIAERTLARCRSSSAELETYQPPQVVNARKRHADSISDSNDGRVVRAKASFESIAAERPLARCRSSSVELESHKPVEAVNPRKRRADSVDAIDESRYVRAKSSADTTHFERPDAKRCATPPPTVSATAGTAPEQQTPVRGIIGINDFEPLDSLDTLGSQVTVVDDGLGNLSQRKIAKPVRRTFKLSSPTLDKSTADKDEGPKDWEDIDLEDAMDPLMAAEYIEDILEYMRSLEDQSLPSTNYMAKQECITWSMRRVLVDWMIRTHSQLHMHSETIFLAVNLVDRFLSRRKVTIYNMQLVGLCGLLVASKYEDAATAHLDNFAYCAGDIYTMKEIMNAERLMLRVVEYDLSYPNPMTFMRRVSKAENYNLNTRTVAKYLMEASLLDHRMLRFKPSELASASICLARKMLKEGPWTPHMVHHSGYTAEELEPCMLLMHNNLLITTDKEYAYAKYAGGRFLNASVFCERWGHYMRHQLQPIAPPFGEFEDTSFDNTDSEDNAPASQCSSAGTSEI